MTINMLAYKNIPQEIVHFMQETFAWLSKFFTNYNNHKLFLSFFLATSSVE